MHRLLAIVDATTWRNMKNVVVVVAQQENAYNCYKKIKT